MFCLYHASWDHPVVIGCFPSLCWCVGESSITVLPLLGEIICTFATATTLSCVCVLVNTLQYHDTVGFVKDSETEDPQ